MSYQLKLHESDDLRGISHFFCYDCATELMVDTTSFAKFLHPRYTSDWDLKWHDFYQIKYIYPELLVCVWDLNFQAGCPNCGCIENTRLVPMDGGLLDLRLIKRSLDTKHNYTCMRCEGVFTSQKCVMRAEEGFICGDCAVFARS